MERVGFRAMSSRSTTAERERRRETPVRLWILVEVSAGTRSLPLAALSFILGRGGVGEDLGRGASSQAEALDATPAADVVAYPGARGGGRSRSYGRAGGPAVVSALGVTGAAVGGGRPRQAPL